MDIHSDQSESQEEETNEPVEFDLLNSMIIDHEGIFITIWTVFDVLLCLVSSWTYMYLTVFSIEGIDTDKMEYYNFFIEIFFFITMAFGFITDFKKQGEKEPEKKFGVISKRYL